MGCLSSAQANPSVVTIEHRQQSNASSIPHKSAETRVHEERSYMKREPSKERLVIDTKEEPKADVFVLSQKQTHEEERISYSKDSTNIKKCDEKKVEENNTQDFKDSGFQNSQSEHSLFKQDNDQDVHYVKDAAEVSTVAAVHVQKVKKNDYVPEYVPPSRDANKSEDTDSGFENPEIASVSAYSPDDNSDDDMF